MLKVIDVGKMGLCNQLFLCANIIASAHYRGYKVEYYKFPKANGIEFSQPELNDCICKKEHAFFIRHIIKILKCICKKNERIIQVNGREDAVKIYINYIRTSKFCGSTYYFWGWPFLDHMALRERINLVREYFSFTQEIKTQAGYILNRGSKDFIVGCHMRRGDYKYWQNGKYYFTDDIYRKNIDKICENKMNGYKMKVILFSNEEISLSAWSSVENYEVIISNGSTVSELCAMSMCDLIVGPPSTYSGWASLIGKVPKYNIISSESIYDPSETFICFYDKDGVGNNYEELFFDEIRKKL